MAADFAVGSWVHCSRMGDVAHLAFEVDQKAGIGALELFGTASVAASSLSTKKDLIDSAHHQGSAGADC